MQDHISDANAGSVPTSELLAQALAEARELAQLEIRIAKAELKEELGQAKRAAIAGSIGAAFALLTFAALLVAGILALGGTAVTALLVAAGLAVVAAAGIALAYASVPKKVLGRTREHLKDDAATLKEHLV